MTESAPPIAEMVPKKTVLDFIYWVTHNDFTDDQGIFVCAEWFNLCSAAGVEMQGAGSEYRPTGAAP